MSTTRTRRTSAGFTLVELMVALTGGLFLSLAVFALARDSGRFYQRESRLANATVSGLIGFQRLRADLGRAGFLSTPNIFRDTDHVCGAPNDNWPTGLRNLASIQLSTPAIKYAALTANGRTPPVVTLAGSYSSPDVFGAKVVRGGNTVTLMLSVKEAASALRRLGNTGMPDDATMRATFPALRALRIVQNGRQYYGQIINAAGGAQPTVTISNVQPPIQFHPDALCGLREVGSGDAVPTINVVNFIQYAIRPLQTPTAIAGYQNVFSNGAAVPGESERTELTRVELDVNGVAINGTEEIVAEYAVDLNLQLIAVTGGTLSDPNLGLVLPGEAQFNSFTGPVYQTGNMPQRIRSVRVRLGVRSREADRTVTVANPAEQGLFRFNVGSGTAETFARVRTFQADVALHNQASVSW